MENGSSELTLRLEILHPNYLVDLLLAEKEQLIVEGSNSSDGCTAPIPQHADDKNLRDSSVDQPRSQISKQIEKNRINKSKKPDKLRFILEEMLHFERRLLESLRILTEINSTICDKNSGKDSTVLREIFKDIPSLYQLHQHLSSGLDSLRATSSPDILPSVFISSKEIPYLNIYKSFMCRYATNYPKLTNLVLKDKEFRNMCTRCIISSKYEEQRIQDVCGMYLGVHSSVTRFKLLISKIEEALAEDDVRIRDVRKALKVLDELLANSEGEIVRQDQILDAHAAFSKIDGRQTEFRHIPPLLKEGPCKKIPRRSSQKRILDRHLFLFSDYLVITMPVNHLGRYQVKSEVMLNGMKLLEIAEDDDIGIPFCFRIKAKELCVELAFGNEAEKTEWWNQLQAAINQELRQLNSVPSSINATDQNLEPVSGSSAIEWVKDEQSTMCAECSAEFTVFNRRHHCRACGKVFCGTCSDYRAPIAFQGNKERVCVIDYYLINSHLKPPTPEIVESILQRMQQEPSTTEAGHLLWCRYTNGMWDLKPFSRATKASSQCIFVTLKPRSTDISGVDNRSSGALRDDSPNGGTQQSDNVSTSHTTNSSDSVTDTLGVPASDASSLKPLQSKRIVPPHYTACLSRVFCALGKDTLLSVYAARADRRAKDQLPLIGTRLFYMDYVHANAERKRLTSSATLPRFFSLRCLLNSPNSLSSDDSVSSTPSQKANKAHVTQNPSKLANPIYRNHKPPPLTPKPNKSVIEAALKQPGICSKEQKEEQLSTLKHSQTLPTLLHVSSFRWTKPGYHTGELNVSENPHLTQNELAKQIASVSPTVFALLRNRLGFILLPMNTDCLAYYFEAPSIEIRTRWINSIRRTCVSYLER
ncbi:hypothetical protein CRM22_010870 [Opisthorchis felineus]|uniref:Uncharacterized protein n=1 Tax=Opisthorchis felineus TaxID=147828 RepID=A0A4S2KK81_OPIFE|nr:hypothetical protein CRM22_010870 [Opisthorchis felineus]